MTPATRSAPPPRPDSDIALPADMCLRCGFPGPHGGPGECIAALRDRIATLEFTGGARTGRKPKARP